MTCWNQGKLFHLLILAVFLWCENLLTLVYTLPQTWFFYKRHEFDLCGHYLIYSLSYSRSHKYIVLLHVLTIYHRDSADATMAAITVLSLPVLGTASVLFIVLHLAARENWSDGVLHFFLLLSFCLINLYQLGISTNSLIWLYPGSTTQSCRHSNALKACTKCLGISSLATFADILYQKAVSDCLDVQVQMQGQGQLESCLVAGATGMSGSATFSIILCKVPSLKVLIRLAEPTLVFVLGCSWTESSRLYIHRVIPSYRVWC